MGMTPEELACCPGVIANSFGGDTLYERIFDSAPEGSWLKYFTRQPNGFRETYPQPAELPPLQTVSAGH